MFESTKIKSFLALAETLNYTKAAKKLFMSQQSISRYIAILEDELGVQLFVRTTRNVELTPAGRMFNNLYHEMLRDYSVRADAIYRKINTSSPRVIKLGLQSYVNPLPVIEVIEFMKKKSPGLTIEVICQPPSDMTDHFNRHMIDMMIVLDRFLSDGIEGNFHELVKQSLCLMVSDRNPNATDNAVFSDFSSLPYISDVLEGEDTVAHRMRLENDIKKWGLDPKSMIWATDRSAAVAYAELGYGILVDSDKSIITRNRRLKLYETGITESIWFAYHKDKHIADIADVLIGKLECEFQKLYCTNK